MVKRMSADERRAFNGYHLVGYLEVSTAVLTALLGEPDDVAGLGDAKTEHEWYLTLDDGTPVTIYNYHDGGRRRLPPPQAVRSWHVGAHTGAALDKLAAALNLTDRAIVFPPVETVED